MLSITADTNAYISGLNFGGEPRRFLNMAESGLFRLFPSDHILAGIRRVLGYPKIGWPEERIEQALRQIRRYTEHVTPTERVSARHPQARGSSG